MKLNANEVRNAAKGQWVSILTALTNIDPAILDGKHHPCPRCPDGGKDRFRMIDIDAGALFCNQCRNKNCGDGFSAIEWLTGCEFKDALVKVAEHLGIKPPKKNDPAKDLEFESWNSTFAGMFLQRQTGITEAELQNAGARIAKYKKKFTVLALPIIGKTLNTEKPVGWVIMNCLEDTLPTYDKNGNPRGSVTKKITYGSGNGLVGLWAIKQLKLAKVAALAWKCEGITDMLAIQSAIPASLKLTHVVVTNSSGTNQSPGWMADLLAKVDCNVIHDADEPGQAGAKSWANEIAARSIEKVKNVELPYEIEETKGKDVRDYLETHDYADLLTLADNAETVEIARTEDGEIDHSQSTFPVQELILKKLQLEVQYEDENNSIRVFSTLLRKSSWIKNIGRVSVSELVSICGSPAKTYISSDPVDGVSYTLSDVREAIALSASTKRGKHDERGVGVWQGIDDYGNKTETVVLVNETEAARYNGDEILRQVIAPRCDGLILDFGAGQENWFEYEILKANIERAGDHEWCLKQIDDLEEIFGRWHWRKPEITPMLMAGLSLASFIQTLWEFRPLVSITGETNTGKSMFFEFMGGKDGSLGIFGKLAFGQSRSTEAGIRQGIGNTGRVILCDEFEDSRDRIKIMEILRAATRGDTVARGTAGDQKGKTWRLRHLAWVAAVETGLNEIPDLNRFIQFELLEPTLEKKNMLVIPESQERYEIGQRLLAIAVRCATKAIRMAPRLKKTIAPGIDARVIEGYAVPAAMLGAAMGYNDEKAGELLTTMLKNVEMEEQGKSDQQELLDSTKGSKIRHNQAEVTVGMMMADKFGSVYDKVALESNGIKRMENGDMFLHPSSVKRHLLRGTGFENKNLSQMLLRLEGAHRSRQRIAGGWQRGIVIPYKVLDLEEHDPGTPDIKNTNGKPNDLDF